MSAQFPASIVGNLEDRTYVYLLSDHEIQEELTALDCRIRDIIIKLRSNKQPKWSNDFVGKSLAMLSEIFSGNQRENLVNELREAKSKKRDLRIQLAIKQNSMLQNMLSRVSDDIEEPMRNLSLNKETAYYFSDSDRKLFEFASEAIKNFSQSRDGGNSDARGEIQSVLDVVDCMENLEFSDDTGATLLHLVSLHNMPEIVKRLIDLDINVNARDKKDVTSLIYACQKGDHESVKLLLGHPEIKVTREDLNKISVKMFLSKDASGHTLAYYFLNNKKLLGPTLSRISEFWNNDEISREFKRYAKCGIDEFCKLHLTVISETKSIKPEIKDRILSVVDRLMRRCIVENIIEKSGVAGFRKYLNDDHDFKQKTINDLIMTLIEIIKDKKDPLSEKWEVVRNVLKRFYQISKIQLEENKVPHIENLKIALFIECDVKKFQKGAEHIFNETKELPRGLALGKHGFVHILSHQRSGDVKRVIRVPLGDLSGKAEIVELQI